MHRENFLNTEMTQSLGLLICLSFLLVHIQQEGDM